MFKSIRKAIGRVLGYSQGSSIASFEAMQERYAKLRATYDAARTSDEFKNYWANADAFDADSAHSKGVRHTLIQRSRYEIGSNGYADGIASTYATDLVGVGPTLRMQTASTDFNQMVEREWYAWMKADKFRRKLWCLAHAKHQDGEGIGVLRRNPGVRHPIPLSVVLYEAEQCQTPYMAIDEEGQIDGLKFDKFGNPLMYDILRQHPGTSNGVLGWDMEPERVPADRVLHWFKMRRPGQHRGVPESASTLNTGAAARRWREATLGAAETAADFSVLLKTTMTPDQLDVVAPMSTLDIEKRMMTALPQGWGADQMRAEHPTATYEAFHKSLINEQARPKSMPYNKAACDSSSYNYASGRLDHQTYYAALDVEREDCNDLVLDLLFGVWFDLAIAKFGWLGGDPAAVSAGARMHLWDWPKHRVADVESEANANDTNLRNGSLSPSQLCTNNGEDWSDKLPKMAEDFGITPEEMQRRLLDSLYPVQPAGGASQLDEAAVAAALRQLQRRNESLAVKVNGNEAHHG